MEARAQTIVAQRYALHERVGQGGCGVVYRATDQTTGATVAVKMLSRAARQNPSFVERLVREQQALQALAGTDAVAAIDLCRADSGELCLVMEWLEGADLEHHLITREQIGTRFTPDELLHVMRPVLETLAKAHELGIVHRDVKPANIFLLSEDRGVRLLDFGFSRLKSSATLTAADTVMGSPSYIAPEAWLEGSKAIGKQADLYAAGVIVFRALAGHVPFESASLVETMQLVTTAPRPSLSELCPELPKVMDVWLECALAVAPERRFQHAQSFLEALSAALSGVDLPEHTLPSRAAHALPPPPPKTTPGERQNALSTALGRAASLLKRVASSFSRAPTPATEPTPYAPSPEAPRLESAVRLGLAPPPRNPPSRVRTKPALPPLVRPRGNNPESDLLIAELLPPSMPPPALAATALATPSAASAPSAPTDPPAPADPPAPSDPSASSDCPPLAEPIPTTKSSNRAAKPRTRKRPAADKAPSAKAKGPKRTPAKTGSSAKARKAPGTTVANAATPKKAAPAKTPLPKQTAARKQKATKKQPRAVVATPPAALEQTKPKRSASKSRKPKRTRGKTVNAAKGTLDKVDNNTDKEPLDRN